MKTSYFARFDKLVRRGEDNIFAEQGISIARSEPKGTTCKNKCWQLAPSEELLRLWKSQEISWGQYKDMYNKQLEVLEPKAIYDILDILCKIRGDKGEPVLLCWENTDFNVCHRILVANWFEKNLGIRVEEL